MSVLRISWIRALLKLSNRMPSSTTWASLDMLESRIGHLFCHLWKHDCVLWTYISPSWGMLANLECALLCQQVWECQYVSCGNPYRMLVGTTLQFTFAYFYKQPGCEVGFLLLPRPTLALGHPAEGGWYCKVIVELFNALSSKLCEHWPAFVWWYGSITV